MSWPEFAGRLSASREASQLPPLSALSATTSKRDSDQFTQLPANELRRLNGDELKLLPQKEFNRLLAMGTERMIGIGLPSRPIPRPIETFHQRRSRCGT
jgi:hypothetical protein